MAKILLIEDQPQLRQLLHAALRQANHTVFEAENGTRAVAVVAGNSIDVVVTDIFMPEKDGLEVIRDLRRQLPDVPVIAYSGGNARIDMDPLEVALILGASWTIRKPFELQQLLNAVRGVLSAKVADKPQIDFDDEH